MQNNVLLSAVSAEKGNPQAIAPPPQIKYDPILIQWGGEGVVDNLLLIS